MGYLHEGHLSLIRLAKKKADFVAVSIFVNPLQFDVAEDLEKYPRDLDQDISLLKNEGVDLLFTPSSEKLFTSFPKELDYEPSLANNFEGEFRDGHFEGVCTIVKILFDIINPDYAIFGEKDFQQLRIIEDMVKDFSLGIEIIRAPLIRDHDGLALSSRNVRLSEEARKSALGLSKALMLVKKQVDCGIFESEKLKKLALEEINKEVLIRLEYLDIIDEEKFISIDQIVKNTRIILAAHVGGVRLIDNLSIL